MNGIDKVRQIMIICEKKLKKVYRFKKLKKVYRFKMAAILLIFLSRDRAILYHKDWKKNTFPKANFNEIWLKEADHQ